MDIIALFREDGSEEKHAGRGAPAPSAVVPSAAPLTSKVAVAQPSKSSLGVAVTCRSTLVAGKYTPSTAFRESKRQQKNQVGVGLRVRCDTTRWTKIGTQISQHHQRTTNGSSSIMPSVHPFPEESHVLAYIPFLKKVQ